MSFPKPTRTDMISDEFIAALRKHVDNYRCAICVDIVQQAYACAPCGHLFCAPCVFTYINNLTEEHAKNAIELNDWNRGGVPPRLDLLSLLSAFDPLIPTCPICKSIIKLLVRNREADATVYVMARGFEEWKRTDKAEVEVINPDDYKDHSVIGLLLDVSRRSAPRWFPPNPLPPLPPSRGPIAPSSGDLASTLVPTLVWQPTRDRFETVFSRVGSHSAGTRSNLPPQGDVRAASNASRGASSLRGRFPSGTSAMRNRSGSDFVGSPSFSAGAHAVPPAPEDRRAGSNHGRGFPMLNSFPPETFGIQDPFETGFYRAPNLSAGARADLPPSHGFPAPSDDEDMLPVRSSTPLPAGPVRSSTPLPAGPVRSSTPLPVDPVRSSTPLPADPFPSETPPARNCTQSFFFQAPSTIAAVLESLPQPRPPMFMPPNPSVGVFAPAPPPPVRDFRDFRPVTITHPNGTPVQLPYNGRMPYHAPYNFPPPPPPEMNVNHRFALPEFNVNHRFAPPEVNVNHRFAPPEVDVNHRFAPRTGGSQYAAQRAPFPSHFTPPPY